MSRQVTIDLLTKVEGHGRVTLTLGADGALESSHFHVTEFRGFEKFCEGRMLWDMPVITTRICGICPVSHHLASVKAAEACLGVAPPPTAIKLRELMHMGQLINSHAMHFFYLAAPDFVVGPDAPPQERSIVGIIERNPELAKKAIMLRKYGQDVVEKVGGRAIHPVTAIPGGMSRSLDHADRHGLAKQLPQALELAKLALATAKALISEYATTLPSLGALDSMHLGMVREGALELYDGPLRLVSASGERVDEFDGARYLDVIAEHVEADSYMKFPYYRRLGWPDGYYRVGPLARLNVAERITTPLANDELRLFKMLGPNGMARENLHYHVARMIELVYAVERAGELLADDDIVGGDYRVRVDRRAGEGVGVLEAPRGTLLHHYAADDDGRVTKVNLIVATEHNNRAIDLSVGQMAAQYIHGDRLEEGLLNRVEMAVRCYDPCLSCATHALGRMPLTIELFGPDGVRLDAIQRD
ncbi:MAG: Ni/Fe hydrogenase subunit alpha [Myxococcota bacterium]